MKSFKKQKNILAIAFLFVVIFILSGCNFIGLNRIATPKDIYKDYIDFSTSTDTDFAEYVSTKRSASVVSIVSSTILRTNLGTSVANVIFSGVIINKDGYIIASSQSAYISMNNGENTYSNKAQSTYAVLPDIYNDSTLYRLKLEDYNIDAGLAIFRFYDNFHYFIDTEKSSSEEGFQIFAEFSNETISIGDRCVSIGNSLGNALNNDVVAIDSISNIQQTVMSGIIADNETASDILKPVCFNENKYDFIITTSPVNLDMYGGGLFDENGYLIGILASKISATDQNGYSETLTRISIAYNIQLVKDYINDTACRIQKPISYTVASINEEADV